MCTKTTALPGVVFVLCLFGRLAFTAQVDLAWVLEQTLEVYAPVSSSLDEGPCKAQGLAFKQAVKDGQSWALNMLDASSKPPSGVLTGNLVQMGSYDQCLDVMHHHLELGLIAGQHCMVTLGADNVFTQETLTDKFQEFRVYQTQAAQIQQLLDGSEIAEAFTHLGATLSVCVPSACSPRDVQRHLETALRAALGVDLNVTVHDNACNSRLDPTPPLAAITVFAIVIILSVFGAVVLGTTYDFLAQKEPRSQLLLAFSLSANFKTLTRSSTSATALPVLDGLRVFSILWVVFYHHYVFNLVGANVNYLILLRTETDWTHIVLNNGTLCVDSFLLLAGTLTAYNFLRGRQKGLHFDVITFFIRRYIRIAPTMLATGLITVVTLSLAAEGPLVKANAAVAREECVNVWWDLLFISNYVPVSAKCVSVNWYLSMDMQLAWVAPLLLVPLWRWPRIGKTLISSLFLGGVALVFAIAYLNEITLSKFVADKQQRGIQERLIYTPTHARFTPWLVGLWLGYVLHSKRRPKRLLAVVAWVTGVAALAASLLCAHRFFQGDASDDRVATSVYVALMRPGWAVGLALLVLVCVAGYGGLVNSVLSWPGFLVPSRLSFCVLFAHWSVVSGYHATVKHSRHFSDASLVVEFLGLAVLSFGSALFLHLFFEAPASALGKLFMDQPPARLAEHQGHAGVQELEKGTARLESRSKTLSSPFRNCEKTK